MSPDSSQLRTDVPHTARVYDYLLGGKDNFAADRAAADQIVQSAPEILKAARDNRRFLARAVTTLVREHGIRQFLDVGTGIPTSPNLHEVAQAIVPEARVVYVDNDPLVLVHARALLTSSPEGATAYLDADLRQAGSIIESSEVTETLDLSKPVGLSFLGILHFFADSSDPFSLVATLVDALPPGSALTISHGTADFSPGGDRVSQMYSRQGIENAARSRSEVARFFEGLDLLDPGIVNVTDWRPEPTDKATVATGNQPPGLLYGGVGIKG
jgi:hypothetical protein